VNYSSKERREKVLKGHSSLSIARQCKLLSVARSMHYYQPKKESKLNLELMRVIDAEHLKYPFKGVKSMTVWLNKDQDYQVNEKRIRRLYKILGIEGIAPKPNTSKPSKENRIYPYLLKNLKISRPNQVWGIDITYIPVKGGYLYLVAIIDLYSRFVVGWSLSNTMQSEWCKVTLQEAIEAHGAPDILNTDQGSQFTSEVFTSFVTSEEFGIRLSMDGKGRAIDNVFIERLWRSLKYEYVYLNPAEDGLECFKGLKRYFEFYNHERRHSSIDDEIPEIYYKRAKKAAA